MLVICDIFNEINKGFACALGLLVCSLYNFKCVMSCLICRLLKFVNIFHQKMLKVIWENSESYLQTLWAQRGQ